MGNDTIGRYEIKSLLGQGGMARVYRAYDPMFQRDVAIKVMHGLGADNADAYERFRTEAQTIAGLEHYAILPVYDFGETDGQPFLVMRLMTGGTLADRIGQLSIQEIDQILSHMCSALEAAHAQNVIHRDLKPANILLDDEGMAYLADFGIARLAEGTQTSSIMGTAHYMAPEQARGEPLDARTDVYQMGVILFEMMTGEQPYKGENSSSLLYQHVYEPIPNLVDVNDRIPDRYEAVIQSAMAKDPRDRPQNTPALYQLFRQQATGSRKPFTELPTAVIADTAVSAPAPLPTVISKQYAPTVQDASIGFTESSPAEPLPENGNEKRPMWLYAAGALALLLLIGIGWWLSGSGNEETINTSDITPSNDQVVVIVSPTAQPTEIPTEIPTETAVPTDAPTATPAPTENTLTQAILTEELGGGTGWAAISSNRTNNFDIYLVQLNPPYQEIQLTTADANDFGPVWSPNGQQIAFHTFRDGNWEIYTMNADGGNKQNITLDSGDDAYPAWLADGQKILFHSNRDGDFDLYMADKDGRNLRNLTNNDIDDFGPTGSPANENIIAFHRLMEDTRQLFILNLADNSTQQLTFGSDDAVFPRWSPDGQTLLFHIDKEDTSTVYLIEPDGSNMRPANTDTAAQFFPQWSPSGNYIAYHARVGSNSNRQIHIVPIDDPTTNNIVVLPDTGDNRMPSWQVYAGQE